MTLDQKIEDDIVFGLYPPGSRLIEDRLIERYNESRHAVRSALMALERRHLIVRQPNRGSEVVEMTPDEVERLYDLRVVLECAAAERTPLPVPGEVARRLAAIAEEHAQAYQAGDPRRLFALNRTFHSLQFSLCGNEPMAEMIEALSRRVQVIRTINYDDPVHMKEVIRQHHALVAAMLATDRARYVAAVQEHLPASAVEYRRLYNRKHGAAA